MSEILKNQKGIEQNVLGLPVDRDFLFSNHKDIYKKGTEKRQTKLFEKISFIKPFLKEDEKIILVTTGCSPISILEQLLTGWIVFYLKRSLFVFTNKRIFHIPTKFNYSYRNSIAQIIYADCLLLLFVVLALVNTLQGIKDGFGSFVFFSIILALEKVITVYHSNHFIKEYIPKEKEIKPIIASQ